MTTKTAWLCAAVLGAAAVAAGADAARDAFGVAILRRDGILIPFATFDGRRWRNDWPAPQPQLVVPINLTSVPKQWWGPLGPRDAWQAWVAGQPRAIRITQPDWVDVHCSRHLALRSDYASREVVPADIEQPYPKDGFAVSPPHAFDPIQTLAATATELYALVPELHTAFNEAERETSRHSNHPLARRARERIDVQIEAAHAFGDSPRYYYVEAMRSYRTLGQRADQCLATAFGTGWFVRDGDRIKSLMMYVDLLPCSRFGASYMLPLGAVRAAGRAFWLAQFSGADHERYTVIEVTPKKVAVMVDAWGGGC